FVVFARLVRSARTPRRPPHLFYGDPGAGGRAGPRLRRRPGPCGPPRAPLPRGSDPTDRGPFGRRGLRHGPAQIRAARVVHARLCGPRQRDRRAARREDVAGLLRLGRGRGALSSRPLLATLHPIVLEGALDRQADSVWSRTDAV